MDENSGHSAMSANEQVDLISELISYGPVYGSDGQLSVAATLAERLKYNGWDNVWLQDYKSGDLIHHPDYVPVSSFGDQYSDDTTKNKQNIIGVLDSNEPGPTLILNGHYDVEPIIDPTSWILPWDSGSVGDGKIWGRGSSDMFGGLTSELSIGSRFARQKGRWIGRIIFCAVTDEEVGGNGSLAAMLDLERRGFLSEKEDTYCLIAEPSDRTVASESLGFMHMLMEVRGIARHIAGSVKSDNALYNAIEVIRNFEEVINSAALELGAKGSDLLYNFGIIRGGVDAATPIDDLGIEGTVFYPSSVVDKELQDIIVSHIAQQTSMVNVRFSEFNFKGHSSPANELQSALLEARPSHSITPGSFRSPCDARVLSCSGIRKVAIYGPGSLKQAHSVDEYLDIDALGEYNDHVTAAITKLLKK